MEKKLPFRSPSPTAWRSLFSGVAVALLALWLGSGAWGLGTFVVLALALWFLMLPFSEWRTVRYSRYALVVALGTFFLGDTYGVFGAGIAGALSVLLFLSAAPHEDLRRIAPRILRVSLTFLASFLLFVDPSLLTFAAFVAVVAFLMRDEARAWNAFRVGEGRLIGAGIGLLGAELAAFAALLPLGPVRSAALVTFTLLVVREGLGEAYQGGLRPALVFQGLAAFFVVAVFLFASVDWRA